MHSDCCLTCWHYGSGSGTRPEERRCALRDIPIEHPELTHCANHPRRFPRRLSLPVGPVYRTDAFGQRVVWRPSPDSEEIRRLLLALLDEMPEAPRAEYPFGIPFDETLVWQLGEFREPRALPGLLRVAAFDPNRSDPVFGLNRFLVIRRGEEALAKIGAERPALESDSNPR